MFCGLVSNDLGVYVLQLLRLVDSLLCHCVGLHDATVSRGYCR
jgi:hypothetical protein